jgi:nitronate monooxygenase
MDWFELTVPVIQAPMGGGPSTPQLVTAVSNAGGMGSIAAGYLQPDEIQRQIDVVRTATDRPFLVNLFVMEETTVATDDARAPAASLLAALRAELGLPEQDDHVPAMPSATAQFAAVLDAAPAAVSFTFGLPSRDWIAALADAGCRTVATATTVAEATAAQRRGVDAICVQGLEAGAHSGSHQGHAPPRRSTSALLVECGDALSTPLIAAGGIMDGRGVAAAIVQGASAVQMGTAFLLCPEAGTSRPHRQALMDHRDASSETSLVRTLTGRWARAIPNRLVTETGAIEGIGYPELHLMTSALRKAAARKDRQDLMALWAGDLYRLARQRPAAEIVAEIGGTLARVLAGWGDPTARPPSTDDAVQR